jgi:IS30 family transposase
MTVKEMLEALAERGYSHRKIATALGCHPNTLYYVTTGQTRDTSYTLGRAIEDLYLTTHCEREQVQSASGVDAAPAERSA